MNRIADFGTSAVPLVVEAARKEEEEIVVKQVISIPEKKETVTRRTTLRIGSEGDEVQAMQVWLYTCSTRNFFSMCYKFLFSRIYVSCPMFMCHKNI